MISSIKVTILSELLETKINFSSSKKDLEKNARLKLSDIKYVRPAGKNSINNLNEILDKKIKNNIKKDDPIVKKVLR